VGHHCGAVRVVGPGVRDSHRRRINPRTPRSCTRSARIQPFIGSRRASLRFGLIVADLRCAAACSTTTEFEARNPSISRYRGPAACVIVRFASVSEGIFLIRSLSPDSSEQLGFALSTPVSRESLGELRADIGRAIAGGIREIVIDVDDIGILDSPIIAALITILRQSRESGASVALQATRKSILDTLSVTALTKVFTIVNGCATVPLRASSTLQGQRTRRVPPLKRRCDRLRPP